MFSILKTIISSLFKKSSIEQFPIEHRIKDPIVRGHIQIEIDNCIYCGICQKKCPTGAIEVIKTSKSWAMEQFKCIQCNCCAEACPKKCLKMVNILPRASYKLTKDVVTLARISDNDANNSNG